MFMNIRYISMFLFSFLVLNGYSKDNIQENMQVHVGAKESKKVQLALVFIEKKESSESIASLIQKDLIFTDRFDVSILFMKKIPLKKDIQKLEDKGFSVVVFIDHNYKKKLCDVRLYDVKKGTMITDKGYVVHKSGRLEKIWAHEISDLIVEKLTHNSGSFCSKLTYCKQLATGQRCICVSDYDGTDERIVAKGNLLLAPRWNQDDEYPSILYSRYTASNVCLMEVDLRSGKQKKVVSYEGLNILPAFAPDSNEVVLCLSCKGNTQLYSYRYDRNKKPINFIQITFNNGNNIAPTILEDDKIIFCSDFQIGRPQLYLLDRKNEKLVCLSENEDVCFAPTYSPVNKKVVYTKMVDGIGQLFLYNVKTGIHKQITFDQGHKQEASWSPCGNYIAFGFSNGNAKRIALQNICTGKRIFVTDENSLCTYPAWSINFKDFPILK